MASPEFTHWSTVKTAPYRDFSVADPVTATSSGRKTAFSEKTHLWMLLDAVTVAVATAMAIVFRKAMEGNPLHPALPLYNTPNVFFLYIMGFTLVLLVVSRSRGLYDSLLGRSGLREQRLTIESCLTSGLILAGALYLARQDSVSRAVVITTIVMTAFLLSLRRGVWRYITYKRFEHGMESRNVLILGTGASAIAVRNHLLRIRHLGFTCKGFVRTNSADDNGPEDVLGDTTELARLVRQHFIDDIFVTGPCERGLIQRLLAEANESGVNVRVFPDLYDGMAWNAPVEYVGQFPTLPLHRRKLPVYGLLLKRLLDIVVASAALVLLWPVMLAVALAVHLDSDGPVLYRSQRIGRKGRTFQCLKFRTMVMDAEARKESLLHKNERDGVLFKISHDPRVTRIGQFLRKYSLDEMPQFFNVLLGDMSIVGPRPPLAGEVSQYELPHLRRLDVLPGITGLWQVQARQDPSFDNYISLDTAYVDNWSIWLDLKIMTRTFGVVLSGTGN
jgi:exopolysaccharide biosynthesis polyprenyl glycosylphosphotransferase